MRHLLKSKTLFPAVLAAVFLVVVTASNAWAQVPVERVLDLATSIEQALKLNADLASARWDLELARMDYEKAQLDQMISPNPSILRQRKLALDRAEQSLKDLETQVRQETERRFFDLLKALKTVELNQSKLKQSQDNLTIVKLKVDLGMESAVSLLDAERALLAAEKALASSLVSVTVGKMNFLAYL
ncbi:MAG: TolC family protein, partial [Firmicutes bacterium]|nr:TolC family protein [Bacillota bacterium]